MEDIQYYLVSQEILLFFFFLILSVAGGGNIRGRGRERIPTDSTYNARLTQGSIS